jgi:16S rRNA (cytosine967-C5)-methyltransferase
MELTQASKARKPAHDKTGPNTTRGERLGSNKPGLAARVVAARILAAVIEKKTSLDGMFDQEHGNPAYRQLSDNDRALTRAIVQSALRQFRRIDAIFTSYLKNPLPEGARALQHILTVGAAQILFLDIPDHSAVDLAVEHAQSDPRTRRFANLVNALLRRLAREKDTILEQVGAISPLPEWFEKRLSAVYGKEAAQRIAEASIAMPAIDISVKSDPEGWANELGGVVLPTGSVRLPAQAGGLTDLPGFAEGEWWVQDAASAIPAKLFGNLSGMKVVDLCAAPGGKTAQLIMAGADVTALDQSASRIRRLKTNLARLGLDAQIREMNMADFKPSELFDAALLDAPCSSTGTIRRHPDIAWTKGPDDIAKLAVVQEKLLDHALNLVRPGGIVVFSNCSLDPLEGEELVERLLAYRKDVIRVPVKAEDWPGLEAAITAGGEVRTTPAMLAAKERFPSGMVGFFAVVLQRKS